VYAAYQVIPGPEATELACFFGVLAGGRLGGLAAGLGFTIPGFSLMLLFSWFYQRYGIANAIFQSVFLGLQPAVCAMTFRAAHKFGETVCRHHITTEVDWRLFLVVCLAAVESVLGVNFFIIKLHLTLLFLALLRGWFSAAALWGISVVGAFIVVIVVLGPVGDFFPQGVGVAAALGNTQGAQFTVGLLGGLVSFGGAYTSIPFIQFETVISGKWISNQLFLDSLALGTLTPAHPLVGGLDEEHPEVLLLDSAAYTLGVGSKTDGTSYNNRWHTDVTFSEEPPMGSLLSARVLPAVGGDTLWADLGAAHDALSAPLRAMLAGMHASHDAAGAFPKGRGGERAPVVHPVVREHPETKRRCLFVNPVFTKHIIGVSEAESKALLGLMYEIMIEPERVVRWNWQQGDLAFWDNRCTAHYAVADYSERRIMHRTTVAGEKPFPPQRQ